LFDGHPAKRPQFSANRLNLYKAAGMWTLPLPSQSTGTEFAFRHFHGTTSDKRTLNSSNSNFRGPCMESTVIDRARHGHHKVAAAIFVGSLVVSAAMLLSAELLKRERYEYHPGVNANTYVIYDRETGRATSATLDTKNPTESLGNK
jgi:hypothetical protein